MLRGLFDASLFEKHEDSQGCISSDQFLVVLDEQLDLFLTHDW